MEDAACHVQPMWTSPLSQMSFPALSWAALTPKVLPQAEATPGSSHSMENRPDAFPGGSRAEAEKAWKGFHWEHSGPSLRLTETSPRSWENETGRQGESQGSLPVTSSANPGPGTRGPAPEDLVSDECQVLGHGKGSVTVVFPFPLPLPGKHQPSVKSVFTCAIPGGQAELVDRRCQASGPSAECGSAQEVPVGSHFINLPLPGKYPQEKESPAGQSPGDLSWSSVIIYWWVNALRDGWKGGWKED